MNSDLEMQIKLNYTEHCQYLQNKYGFTPFDYFKNELCSSRPKENSRTSEGLFIHHNAEVFTGGNLGVPYLAKHNPFEYQKRENLTYCNYIEHLLLHLKGGRNYNIDFDLPVELYHFFNSKGFFWLLYEINELFVNKGSTIEWRNNCYLAIMNLFDDYINILKGTLYFLEDSFIGDKDFVIKPNSTIIIKVPVIEDETFINGRINYSKRYVRKKQIIVAVDRKKGSVLLRDDDGSEEEREYLELKDMFHYPTVIDNIRLSMSGIGNTDKIWEELYSLFRQPYSEHNKEVAKYISNWSKPNEL